MGNSASTAGPGDREVSTDGFRVLSVQPNSPASDIIVFPSAEAARDGLRAPLHASLISYLDFIVSVNGEALTEESEWFADEIKANVDQPVILEIFNYKWGKFRTVQVVPRSNWGGEGLLGLHVRFDSMEKAAESVLHVVDVAPGSPAADAGLVAADDFILGSAEGSFESVDVFGDYVAVTAGSSIHLYVLRASTDTVREVLVHCTESGIGLTAAAGHMHQLPNRFSPGRNEFELLIQARAAAAAAAEAHHQSAATSSRSGGMPSNSSGGGGSGRSQFAAHPPGAPTAASDSGIASLSVSPRGPYSVHQQQTFHPVASQQQQTQQHAQRHGGGGGPVNFNLGGGGGSAVSSARGAHSAPSSGSRLGSRSTSPSGPPPPPSNGSFMHGVAPLGAGTGLGHTSAAAAGVSSSLNDGATTFFQAAGGHFSESGGAGEHSYVAASHSGPSGTAATFYSDVHSMQQHNTPPMAPPPVSTGYAKSSSSFVVPSGAPPIPPSTGFAVSSAAASGDASPASSVSSNASVVHAAAANPPLGDHQQQHAPQQQQQQPYAQFGPPPTAPLKMGPGAPIDSHGGPFGAPPAAVHPAFMQRPAIAAPGQGGASTVHAHHHAYPRYAAPATFVSSSAVASPGRAAANEGAASNR